MHKKRGKPKKEFAIQQRRAALELSIGTIVIVVLGMTMLILGLVLVKSIFEVANKSINTIDDKVTKEVTALFTDEGDDVVVHLGSDKTAKIKSNTESFGLVVGARTPDGSKTTKDRLQYRLSLDTITNDNCVKKLGAVNAQELFKTPLAPTMNKFDAYQSSNALALVELSIPKGTLLCSQKVYVEVFDTAAPSGSQEVGGTYFKIKIIR